MLNISISSLIITKVSNIENVVECDKKRKQFKIILVQVINLLDINYKRWFYNDTNKFTITSPVTNLLSNMVVFHW
jgi:hypothetical protein